MPIMKWSNENKKFVNYYKTVELVVRDFRECYVISTYLDAKVKTQVEEFDNLYLAQRRFAQIVSGLLI